MRKSYNVFFKLWFSGFFFSIILGNQDLVLAQKTDPYALLIFNFGKSTASHHEGDQFTFMIVGDPGLANSLKQISKNEKIKGKPISVKVCRSMDQIGTPQVLFVPASESGLLPQISDQTKGKPVKILTEKPSGIMGAPDPRKKPEITFI